jgi:hypothetical protein
MVHCWSTTVLRPRELRKYDHHDDSVMYRTQAAVDLGGTEKTAWFMVSRIRPA